MNEDHYRLVTRLCDQNKLFEELKVLPEILIRPVILKAWADLTLKEVIVLLLDIINMEVHYLNDKGLETLFSTISVIPTRMGILCSLYARQLVDFEWRNKGLP